MLLEFIGAEGGPAAGKHNLLPMDCLDELDQRFSVRLERIDMATGKPRILEKKGQAPKQYPDMEKQVYGRIRLMTFGFSRRCSMAAS